MMLRLLSAARVHACSVVVAFRHLRCRPEPSAYTVGQPTLEDVLALLLDWPTVARLRRPAKRYTPSYELCAFRRLVRRGGNDLNSMLPRARLVKMATGGSAYFIQLPPLENALRLGCTRPKENAHPSRLLER